MRGGGGGGRGTALCYFPGERSYILCCLERFPCLRKHEEYNKAEVCILLWKFQGSSPPILTQTIFSSLISMENRDVDLFHDCHISTVQSCTFKIEVTLNKLKLSHVLFVLT